MTLKALSPLIGLLRRAFSWLSRPASRKSSASATPIMPQNLNVQRVLVMLKNEEGVRDKPYRDHLGYLTIGVGHLIDPRKGGSLPKWAQDELDDLGRLTPSTIDKILEDDILEKVEQIKTHIPWAVALDPVRFAVLLDMTFQMGIGGVLGFKNTLRHIQNGDYEQAATNMKASLWYRQTPNRAERRIKEMRTGVFHRYV